MTDQWERGFDQREAGHPLMPRRGGHWRVVGCGGAKEAGTSWGSARAKWIAVALGALRPAELGAWTAAELGARGVREEGEGEEDGPGPIWRPR
jgi:hypothetical protein